MKNEGAPSGEAKRNEGLEDMRARVKKMAETLKAEGYDFEIEETADEFLVHLSDRISHFLKTDQFPVVSPEGKGTDKHIEEVIRETIKNPGANLYEAFHPEK